MKQRCLNPKDANYGHYGGRGITVCERWLTFANFLADMGVMPEGLTLERVDNEKGYSPANCVWATTSDQARNKRRLGRVSPVADSHREAVKLLSKTHSTRSIAKTLGVSKSYVHRLIHE